MSDTDLTALKRQFTEKFNEAQITDTSEAFDVAWAFIEVQFRIAVPLSIYEQASTNVARLQAMTKALPGTDELVLLLESVMYDRGKDIRLWPEDEQAMYDVGSNTSLDEGISLARRRVFIKAAEKIGQRIDVFL